MRCACVREEVGVGEGGVGGREGVVMGGVERGGVKTRGFGGIDRG